MKKYVFHIGIALVMFLISCEAQVKNQTAPEPDQQAEPIVSQLEKQLRAGGPSDYDTYNYSQQDFEVTLPVLKRVLAERGYKELNKADFAKKIKLIFDRTIDPSSPTKYLYKNFYNKCQTTPLYHPNSADIQGVFMVKEGSFITDFYALPQIINYKKDFPDLMKAEQEEITVYDAIEKVNVKIEHWKDLANLDVERELNLKTLISRNKYLFNEDKNQLYWLWENDKNFLKTLVKEFGYISDAELLKLVFDDTVPYVFDDKTTDAEGFGELLWRKDCKGKITVHQNTLDLIKSITTPERPEYLAHLSDYINYLALEDQDSIPLKQKAKLLATLVAFGQNICIQAEYANTIAKKGSPRNNVPYKELMVKVFASIGDGDRRYSREFKLNNYYNIPHLKEWWDDAKTALEKDPDNQ